MKPNHLLPATERFLDQIAALLPHAPVQAIVRDTDIAMPDFKTSDELRAWDNRSYLNATIATKQVLLPVIKRNGLVCTDILGATPAMQIEGRAADFQKLFASRSSALRPERLACYIGRRTQPSPDA